MVTRTSTRTARAAIAAVVCLMLSLLGAPAAFGQGSEVVFEGVTPVGPTSVPNGTTLEGALAALPETTTILVSERDPIPVALDWSLREQVQTDRGGGLVDQVWYPTARGLYEMRGTFELPDGGVQPDPALPTEVIAQVELQAGPLLTLDSPALDQPGTYGEAAGR